MKSIKQRMHASNTESLLKTFSDFFKNQLQVAIANLELSDFKDIDGLADSTKTSPALRAYFEVYNDLGEFIVLSFINQPKPSLLFQQWLNIADYLFQQSFFEGFMLIIHKLRTVANDAMVVALEPGNRQQYYDWVELTSPLAGFQRMVGFLSQQQLTTSYYPLPIWFRKLTSLDAERAANAENEPILKKVNETNLLNSQEKFFTQIKTQLSFARSTLIVESEKKLNLATALAQEIHVVLTGIFFNQSKQNLGWFGGEEVWMKNNFIYFRKELLKFSDS